MMPLEMVIVPFWVVPMPTVYVPSATGVIELLVSTAEIVGAT